MTGSGRRSSARSRIKSKTDANEDGPLRNAGDHRRNTTRDHTSLRLLNVNIKMLLGFTVFTFFIIWFLINRLVNPDQEPETPRVITPFPAPKLMDLPMVIFIFVLICICTFFFFTNTLFCFHSFKVSIKRACTGALIALMFILAFAPGISFY